MHLLYLYICSIASARARNWTIVVIRCRFLGGSKLNLQRPSSPHPLTAVLPTVFLCVLSTCAFSPRANTIIVVAVPRKTAAPAMYTHTRPRPLTW